jgi:hypothetical protein
MYFDPVSGAPIGGPFMGAAFDSLTAAAGDIGGGALSASGGGGGFVFDPLAGLTTDPTVYVTAPDLSTTPVSPTIGGAVDLSPTGGSSIGSSTLPAETPIGSTGTIDPSTGLPVFVTTTAVGPTLSDLNNLPLINPVTIPSYLPPIDAGTGQPTTVSTFPPISVFDPSQLPNVTAPVTPYGGILPPVQPPAPPAPSLLSRIGNAIKQAASGLSGGSAGGPTAPPRAPGTTPAQQPKPTTAGILGTGSLFPWLLLGGIAYLVFRKDGK